MHKERATTYASSNNLTTKTQRVNLSSTKLLVWYGFHTIGRASIFITSINIRSEHQEKELVRKYIIQ